MNLERLNSIRTKKTADGRFISFVKNDTQLTFAAADEWCRSVGGHLPIPKNENENDLLGGTWLGFTVNDKDTLTYFNWATGHPNDDSDNVHTVNKQWYTKKNVIQRAICYLSISDNENMNLTTLDEGFLVSKNNLYQTIPVLFQEWILSVEIKLVGEQNDVPNSILYIGTGDDHGFSGDPTIVVITLKRNSNLVFISSFHNDKNVNLNSIDLARNIWTKFEISMTKVETAYSFVCRVNGVSLFNMTRYPEIQYGVNIYASNNRQASANARIKNLKLTTFDTNDTFFSEDYEMGADLTISTFPDTSTTTTTTSSITTTLTGTNIIKIVLSTY